ncbi:MAG: hypothetical protein KIS77_05720 [Saprospiraceae bacterium]|nr:hypothetical protein [Saprospiraceae bacterium]
MLMGLDSPIFNSENQQGGYANNYLVQNGAEAVVAAKDETIEVLKGHLQVLEADNQDLRGQLQRSMERVLKP